MIEGDFQAPNWLDLQRLHHNPDYNPYNPISYAQNNTGNRGGGGR